MEICSARQVKPWRIILQRIQALGGSADWLRGWIIFKEGIRVILSTSLNVSVRLTFSTYNIEHLSMPQGFVVCHCLVWLILQIEKEKIEFWIICAYFLSPAAYDNSHIHTRKHTHKIVRKLQHTSQFCKRFYRGLGDTEAILNLSWSTCQGISTYQGIVNLFNDCNYPWFAGSFNSLFAYTVKVQCPRPPVLICGSLVMLCMLKYNPSFFSLFIFLNIIVRKRFRMLSSSTRYAFWISICREWRVWGIPVSTPSTCLSNLPVWQSW